MQLHSNIYFSMISGFTNATAITSAIPGRSFHQNSQNISSALGNVSKAPTSTDLVSISPKARKLVDNSTLPESSGTPVDSNDTKPQNNSNSAETDTTQSPSRIREQNGAALSPEQLAELRQLKQRDAEVRSHEQAHLSTAGQYARGGASFTYQRGPDGSSYAVGGEVGIDISTEASPDATILKMRTIKRAALAPANPSGADKRIAAQASAQEAQARQELLQINQEKLLAGRSGQVPTSEPHTKATGTKVSSISGSSYGSLQAKLSIYQQMSSLDQIS